MPGSFSRRLGGSVAVVALLNAISGLSMPVDEREPGATRVVLWLVLLLAHAAAYWFGERLRARHGMRGYVIAQAALLFAIALSRPPMPVIIGLFMACTAEVVLLAGARWGTTRITLGAIVVFVLASVVTSGLYFAATAGLMLAVTGVLAHAIAGLAAKKTADEAAAATESKATAGNGAWGLSVREDEVLRELVTGARNTQIAAKLGISERTVKSHLKSIFQKLGVESRSAAVAVAVQRTQRRSVSPS